MPIKKNHYTLFDHSCIRTPSNTLRILPNAICNTPVEYTAIIASASLKKRLKIMKALIINEKKANTEKHKPFHKVSLIPQTLISFGTN